MDEILKNLEESNRAIRDEPRENDESDEKPTEEEREQKEYDDMRYDEMIASQGQY